jgi:hypothetical protein
MSVSALVLAAGSFRMSPQEACWPPQFLREISALKKTAGGRKPPGQNNGHESNGMNQKTTHGFEFGTELSSSTIANRADRIIRLK